jgi:ribulose-phosphate 3-epimerase
MKVIPAINEAKFEKIKERLFAARDFGEMNLHIDVTDGKFTAYQTWNDVRDLLELRFIANNFGFKIGIHLMVQNPDDLIDSWFKAGMHAAVIPFETIKNLEIIMEKCRKNEVMFILSVNPSTQIDSLGDIKRFEHIQLLAVEPGAAGQNFQDVVIDKIKKLREKGFSGKIIIDGGINPDTARRVKFAGADVVISASYIWNNADPKKGYEALKAI